jgi:hypothetical protein
MKTLFTVGLILASSLALEACSTTDGIKALNAFEKDLKARNCGSGGDITLTAGTVTSLPGINGHYQWDCPKGVPATIPDVVK